MTAATSQDDQHRSDEPQGARHGVILALVAFGVWGLTPIYFHAISGAPLGEILAHRVIWTAVLLAPIVFGVARRRMDFAALLRDPRRLSRLALTSLVIAVNWLVFIWAIGAGRTLETGLGYYLNPLMNVAIGFIALGERFTPPQRAALALAAVGVAVETIDHGGLPWVALSVSSLFAIYGYIRKVVDVGPILGLFVETAMMLPAALIYLAFYFEGPSSSYFFSGVGAAAMLMLAGPLTATPLAAFVGAARRLRLSTVGLFQYIAPTLVCVEAVYLFGEPITAARVVALALIWCGLALYSADSLNQERQARRRRAAERNARAVQAVP